MATVNLSTNVSTLVESEGTVLTLNFDVVGDIPEGGLPVDLSIDAESPLWITDFNNFSRTGVDAETGEFNSLFILRNPSGLGGEISSFSGSVLVRNVPIPFDTIPVILNENQASFELTVFDDFFAEENEVIEFSVGDGTPAVVTIQDGPDGTINPSDVPTIGISIDAPAVLVEDDPDNRTLTLEITTTGDIPDTGIPILLESAFDSIGEFDVSTLVASGIADGRFGGVAPVELGRGFVTTVTDSVATISIDVFNDIDVEGLEDYTFTLVDGEGYNVDPTASSATISIDDAPVSAPIEGTAGRDRLNGTNRNDTILGLDGSDFISGGDGNDVIDGGDGKDFIDGDGGIDIIDGGAGKDTIRGGDSDDFITGGDGNDNLSGGDGFDTIDGGKGNDTIDGGAGRNTISGGRGNDRIFSGDDDSTADGGAGNDELSGGQGYDTFVLMIGGGIDTITDFAIDIDRIGLSSGLSFNQLTLSGNDIMAGNEVLATLKGVAAEELTENSFTTL